MKIGLGTVQFGTNYGISNNVGQTPIHEVKRILEYAEKRGVKVIDTAPLYGNSEEVLGTALTSPGKFNIVTKTPKYNKNIIAEADILELEETFIQSLKKLNQNSIYGLITHHTNDLLTGNGVKLWNKMQELKGAGLVKKIGVSVYTSAQIDRVLDSYKVDLVQLPINVFDQRLIQSGHLAALKKQGIEIHVRSVFLQGLLLMDADNLPNYLTSARPHLKKYYSNLQELNLTPLQASLGFLLANENIDVVLCGVNTLQQAEEIFDVASENIDVANFERFALSDEKILDPSNWG